MCGEMFKKQVGVDMTHVPYRGSAPALNDLIPGRLDVMIDSVSGLVPHIRSGSLRALGVTAKRPLPVLPELRPLADTALPGFDAAGLVAALAPAKTPPEIVARIAKDFNTALLEPATKKRLEDLGDEVMGSPPQALAAVHQVRDGQVGAADQGREDQAGWLSRPTASPPSFRGALKARPGGSITTTGGMDSGSPLRGVRNDVERHCFLMNVPLRSSLTA